MADKAVAPLSGGDTAPIMPEYPQGKDTYAVPGDIVSPDGVGVNPPNRKTF